MPKAQLSAFESTVTRASKGDPDAFQNLVNLFQQDIFRLVFFRIHSEMDAQDITQEVFLQAMKKIGRLESTDSFKHWIYRIAVNKVRDYMRKKRILSLFIPLTWDDADSRSADAPLTDETPGMEDRLERKEFWEQVKKLTLTLSFMEKEVFMLRFFDQLQLSEIAIVLRKSESTVKTHLYRAVAKIRENPENSLLLESGRT